MENFGKLPNKKKLGLAGMALIAQLGGDPAAAESKQAKLLQKPQGIEHVAKPVAIDALKEGSLKLKIANAQKKLQSQDVQDAINGNGENILPRIINAMEMPVTGDDLMRTSWDPSELHRRYAVQVTWSTEGFNSIIPSSSGHHNKIRWHYRAPYLLQHMPTL